jgi:hypothetical protein
MFIFRISITYLPDLLLTIRFTELYLRSIKKGYKNKEAVVSIVAGERVELVVEIERALYLSQGKFRYFAPPELNILLVDMGNVSKVLKIDFLDSTLLLFSSFRAIYIRCLVVWLHKRYCIIDSFRTCDPRRLGGCIFSRILQY